MAAAVVNGLRFRQRVMRATGELHGAGRSCERLDTVRVNVDIGTHAARRLCFQDTIERRRRTLSKIETGSNAAIVGEDTVYPVLVDIGLTAL